MNIFYFSRDPKECAKQTCDKHIIRGIMDLAFLISEVLSRYPGFTPFTPHTSLLYDTKNVRIVRPISRWSINTYSNFLFCLDLLEAYCKEYTFRYNKIHAVELKMVNKINSLRRTLSFMDSLADAFISDSRIIIYDSADTHHRLTNPSDILTYFFPPPRLMPGLLRKKRSSLPGYPNSVGDLHFLDKLELDSLLVIQSYRDYYRIYKKGIATWKGGPPLWWYNTTGIYEDLEAEKISILRRVSDAYRTTGPHQERQYFSMGPSFRGYDSARPVGEEEIRYAFTALQR